MSNPSQPPNKAGETDLIESFFGALRLRHLSRCQDLLQDIAARAHGEPSLAPWSAYLRGILSFEVQHDWAAAERQFRAVVKRTDLEPGMRARVLYALGRSLDAQGRWPAAIEVFQQCLDLATEQDWPEDRAKAWKHMAITTCQGYTHGDYGAQELAQAIAYCQSALETLGAESRVGVPPDDDVAWLVGSIHNTLGLLHRNLGHWDEALACYQRDLDICRDQGDRYGMGLTYGNLGEIHQHRGCESWPQALQAYQQALSIIREFDDRYQETEALANLGFLHQEMGHPQKALDNYLLAIARIEDLRAGVSDEGARAGFFSTVVDTYAHAVLLCLELDQPRRAFDLVERARSRAFLDMLAAGSPRLPPDIQATPLNLDQVQAALPEDTLLVEYFTSGLVEAGDTRHQGTSPTAARHRFPPARTLAFCVSTSHLHVHQAPLSPNDLLPRRLDSVVERHYLAPRIRRTLYDALLAPIEPLVQGKRRLYLVPHGPLHYIPFQALTAADGETVLRAGGPELVYAPSASTLLRSTAGRRTGAAEQSCLALGYNGTPNDALPALRFAEDEARCVAQQCAGRHLTGAAPKKAALYSSGGDYRLLHFSCHGLFDPQAPLTSALRLAPDETLTALDVIEHLHLHCDLVTLSACESGLSRVRRGDELMGLQRAFLYAGTPALVATLWRVDERSTRILMERFYEYVLDGCSFAQALKRAQLALQDLTRTEARAALSAAECQPEQHDGPRALDAADGEEHLFADPYYWAAFVLVGQQDAV